ncbi:hypothetical protein PCE31106_02713 [Pandoraea cepalis]|uniref:Uncharacterized protein n=1 Tax=Pandoraea cepalis TaxID=2508294 RepID=A0A5E4VKY0_9BURK|nr:hypothetical protein PCE31106_02713 [Pandoraea cepalis]
MPVCREAHGQTIFLDRAVDTGFESVEEVEVVNNESGRRRFDGRAAIDALGAIGVVSRAFVLPPSCRRVTLLLTSVAAHGELF